MFAASVKLLNFKNYTDAAFGFTQKFVLLNGSNGSGKTNLIDAIYYLCLCRSYFTRSDNLSPRHGEAWFRIDGDFIDGTERFSITCKYQGGKKEFFKNGSAYDRLSDHIGLIPVVMIAPEDISIINDGSEERRRFIDTAISQLDHEYLLQLMMYNKILLQRNAALKQFSENHHIDHALLGVLNNQLATSGNFIFQKRGEYIEIFREHFRNDYNRFCGGSEIPFISYESQLMQNDILHLLMNNVKSDLESQRTGFGIHKDDLVCTLDDHLLRETGSQGQVKSYLIAMKLSQFRMMLNASGKKPVLLLDDIFEKLDKPRLHALFSILNGDEFEQVFITDADEARSTHFFKEAGIACDHIIVGDLINS